MLAVALEKHVARKDLPLHLLQTTFHRCGHNDEGAYQLYYLNVEGQQGTRAVLDICVQI